MQTFSKLVEYLQELNTIIDRLIDSGNGRESVIKLQASDGPPASAAGPQLVCRP